MGEKCPIGPTKGPRTFQSAGMGAEFVQRDAREAIRRGDYDEYLRVSDSVSDQEHAAACLSRDKIGGAPGGATFQRSEIMVPPKPVEKLPGIQPVNVQAPTKAG